MTLKEARLTAGFSQQQMSDALEIPKRTIEDWEAGRRKCPKYVERLVINELLRIAENKNS